MSIYVISDLHLSFSIDKPMHIFGENWTNHYEKIKEDWKLKVKKEDTVFLLGDFSWGLSLEDTKKDFEYLNNLPGKKILLKGNHDYWWTTVKKMKTYLNEKNFLYIDFLFNNSFFIENYIFVGTKWFSLNDENTTEKIINREKLRLENSIKQAVIKYGEDKKIIIFTHYPIIYDNINNYNIEKCIFGHIHGDVAKDVTRGYYNNIEYILVSCDYTEFKLIKIVE